MSALQDAKLQLDLAKIDVIVEQARVDLNDAELNMFDVAAIMGAASEFRVTPTMAYHRAMSLGMLSYQKKASELAR